ncbi:hypothetical protein STAFG_3327 [Streptomyces afghaniensis 772]|uniref:Uncharacterized protein n=1 Tax=Streptomyces afghaniensis 772 TaxID=1283301 RepID=S4NML0_9ACTN|nr:hypothetical protein STAFG_3327 [Streptomyces afghaniensis 772]
MFRAANADRTSPACLADRRLGRVFAVARSSRRACRGSDVGWVTGWVAVGKLEPGQGVTSGVGVVLSRAGA